MSDSDEDLMPNNVLKYQRDPTTINANSNFNNTNITGYTFRSNMMTSTFNMPHLERQRYGMRGVDNRSTYYRRETSPMSLRSFPDSGIQNFHNSLYTRGMSSQRSVFNGRSGSPVSMRSIDSNASVSAADIALAFKNVKFNKYDLRMIKEAYNKFMKNRVRKKIEKRRNLKLFLKGNRKRSGEDSGEQGSDSSISSDDCRSSRTILHKENIPRSIHRPLKTHDLSHFRTSIKESNMYKDCTNNFKQNSLRNIVAVTSLRQNHIPQENIENTSVVMLKERFKKGSSFLLPSQRFNKSTVMSNEVSLTNFIPFNNINKDNHCIVTAENINHDTDSDKEEIFSQNITRDVISQQNSNQQRKRVLEVEETNASDRKRNKITMSPIKRNDCISNDINIQKNDFNFKKPQMPIRKTSIAKKDQIPEILIAKSRQPLTGSLEIELPIDKLSQPQHKLHNPEDRHALELQNKYLQNTELEPDCSNQAEITYNSTTDVSMKPSFLKRKLFTQKLDVAESKNMSNDNLAIHSPQNTIYSACREKNKVRKLVSSQSCLSRDVGDDNVLDLIHKIVHPDQMNITAATNRKDLGKSNHENDDKWDVASVISMCNNDEGSDTYTDEEIFKNTENSKKTNNKQVNNSLLTTDKQTTAKCKVNDVQVKPKNQDKKLTPQCKVVIQKLQLKPNHCNDNNKLHETQCHNKRTVSSCVKSFWDTDFESDMEERSITPWTSRNVTKPDNNTQKEVASNCSKLNINKRNVAKGTILTVRSFQNKGINSSMSCRSDISRISRRKESDKYQEKIEENNNEMLNRTTRSKQNEEIKSTEQVKAKEQVVPSSKTKKESKLKSELSKDKEKSNVKTIKTKEPKTNKQSSQDRNECNTSRESLRLKQKREKANLSTQVSETTTKPKRGRQSKNTKEKSNEPVQKKHPVANKKNNETSNKDTKPAKNPTIKNGTLNRTRQTPRKNNEKKQLSATTEQSSLNISNISSRSLRVRSKNVK
nr:uncharacterized protein LOC113399143 [Vanessa tameamea]